MNIVSNDDFNTLKIATGLSDLASLYRDSGYYPGGRWNLGKDINVMIHFGSPTKAENSGIKNLTVQF